MKVKNVSIEDIAKMTAGLAGADLANIVNEAALLAGRHNKKEVEQSDFLEAIERAIAGLEKKSRRIDEKEKKASVVETGRKIEKTASKITKQQTNEKRQQSKRPVRQAMEK